MRCQVTADIWIFHQQVNAVADQVGRGLVPCVEQENAVMQKFEFGKPLFAGSLDSKLAGAHQSRQDLALVERTLALPPCSKMLKIVLEFRDRPVPAFELLLGQDGLQGTEDCQRPVA